jgi:hypothetical protein
MDEEKGQEWGILAQTHNVAANSWGKGGLGNGQSFTFFMLLLRMGPQNLILYAKKMLVVEPDYLPDSEVLSFSHVYTP